MPARGNAPGIAPQAILSALKGRREPDCFKTIFLSVMTTRGSTRDFDSTQFVDTALSFVTVWEPEPLQGAKRLVNPGTQGVALG
jgi:hypothetical protein